MKKRTAYVLAMGLLLSGCAGVGALPRYTPLTENDVPEIAVRSFDATEAEGTYTEKTDFGTTFAKYLAGYLQNANYKAIVVDKSASVQNCKYVIEGKISQIEAGSAATRFWVGMGAGAARMTISLKLSRVADNKILRKSTDTASDLISTNENNALRRIQEQLARQFSDKIVARLQAADK